MDPWISVGNFPFADAPFLSFFGAEGVEEVANAFIGRISTGIDRDEYRVCILGLAVVSFFV